MATKILQNIKQQQKKERNSGTTGVCKWEQTSNFGVNCPFKNILYYKKYFWWSNP